MSPWSWSRLLGLWWLVPAQLVACAVGWFGTFSAEAGYVLAEQVRASEAVMLALPLSCLAAAVAAARLVRSGFLDRPAARPRSLTVGAVLGLLGLPLLLILVGLQAWAVRSDPLAANPSLVAIPVAWSVVALLFGWFVGSRLSLRIAAPAAVLVPYLVVAFPPGLSPGWLRHLVGLATGCCSISEQLDPRAVWAALITAAALGLALWWLVTSRPRTPWAAAGAIPVAAGLGAASLLASGIPTQAVVPRDGAPACLDYGIPVCVWPEHEAETRQAETQIRAVSGAADTAGILLPTRITEQPDPAASWPVAPFGIREGADPDRVATNLLHAFVPAPDPACQERLATTGFGSQAAAEADASALYLIPAWLADRAGVGAADPGPDPQVNQLLENLQARPDGGAAYIRQTQQMILDCYQSLPEAG